MKEHEDLLFTGRKEGEPLQMMEIDAVAIGRILQAHGARLDVATRAANAIVDHLVECAKKAGALPQQ